MRTRFTVNDRGELESRDGVVLGRLTSLTLESANSDQTAGTIGVSSSSSNTEKERKETPLPPDVAAVWGIYDRLIGKGRRELNPKRRRDIDNALKVRDLETVKRAVVGLSRSTHHNGQNPQGTKYLDIRYALRGNVQQGESNDERIDRMAALAGDAGPAETAVPSTQNRGVLEGRVDDCKRRVLRAANLGKRRQLFEHEAAERDEAIVELSRMGITVVYRQEDNWPTFEDKEQGA